VPKVADIVPCVPLPGFFTQRPGNDGIAATVDIGHDNHCMAVFVYGPELGYSQIHLPMCFVIQRGQPYRPAVRLAQSGKRGLMWIVQMVRVIHRPAFAPPD
jgi:hypothetical protein